MKWLGQNIYDYISRFRNHTYFEDSITLSTGKSITLDEYTSGTISITKVQDSGTTFNDNDTSLMTAAAVADKIEAYGYSTTSGDITGVDITGGTNITVASETGTTSGNYSCTLNVDDAFLINSGDDVMSGILSLRGLIVDGDRSVTPGDGGIIHMDTHTVTDTNTSASGTAAMYTHVNIEAPRLAATNLSVTTTAAASLYIQDAPTVSSNQTITNNYALWVDAGLVKFDGALTVDGTITGDVTGDVTGDASGTAATVTAGTQAAITSCANLATVGTIGTGVWQGTAIASAYLDADTMHYSAQRQLTHHLIKDDIDTTKIYISLQEIDTENTNTSNKNLPILAPVAGKLLKVSIRANNDLSGVTLTWRLETRASSASTFGSPSVIGTQSGAGCTASSMTTYDFTSSLDSGTNAIAAGDQVLLSIQSDGATSDTTYLITCLWEWDLS